MENRIKLVELLKDCPNGTKLYSTIFGEVEFVHINCSSYTIVYKTSDGINFYVTDEGKFFPNYDGECTLYPSKEQRDWSKFTAPWYKKEIEPRFNVGDWIVDKFGDSWHIDSFDKKNYQVSDGKGNYNYFPISKQDEMHLWTINDAKDGDVIHFGAVTAIFKKYIGREECICYCSFCKDGGFEIPIENGDDNVYGCYNATPATKEQCDTIFSKMKEEGYEFEAKKKRFDPKTLEPFDRVLARTFERGMWYADIISISADKLRGIPDLIGNPDFDIVIPYNEDTKHLAGTSNNAPEYYRYWED